MSCRCSFGWQRVRVGPTRGTPLVGGSAPHLPGRWAGADPAINPCRPRYGQTPRRRSPSVRGLPPSTAECGSSCSRGLRGAGTPRHCGCGVRAAARRLSLRAGERPSSSRRLIRPMTERGRRSLSTLPGTRHVELDVLPEDETLALLAAIAGASADARPDARSQESDASRSICETAIEVLVTVA